MLSSFFSGAMPSFANQGANFVGNGFLQAAEPMFNGFQSAPLDFVPGQIDGFQGSQELAGGRAPLSPDMLTALEAILMEIEELKSGNFGQSCGSYSQPTSRL